MLKRLARFGGAWIVVEDCSDWGPDCREEETRVGQAFSGAMPILYTALPNLTPEGQRLWVCHLLPLAGCARTVLKACSDVLLGFFTSRTVPAGTHLHSLQ